MNSLMENELAELAHAMRLLTIRYLEGNLARAEHSRELVALLNQFRLMDAKSSPRSRLHRTEDSAGNCFAEGTAFAG